MNGAEDVDREACVSFYNTVAGVTSGRGLVSVRARAQSNPTCGIGLRVEILRWRCLPFAAPRTLGMEDADCLRLVRRAAAAAFRVAHRGVPGPKAVRLRRFRNFMAHTRLADCDAAQLRRARTAACAVLRNAGFTVRVYDDDGVRTLTPIVAPAGV